jgi:hypothetical protein
VNLQASLSANPAPQESLAESVDVHQHALVGLFHLGHGMGFQTQLFSDKRLYEHLGSGPFVFLGLKPDLSKLASEFPLEFAREYDHAADTGRIHDDAFGWL